MGGGKRKHPEGGIRINYLHQARHHVLRKLGGPVGRLMAASMGQHMVAVGKKSQVRLDGEIKKTLCKVGPVPVFQSYLTRKLSKVISSVLRVVVDC